MTKVNPKKSDKNFQTLSPYLSVWSLDLNCVAPSEKNQEDRSQAKVSYIVMLYDGLET